MMHNPANFSSWELVKDVNLTIDIIEDYIAKLKEYEKRKNEEGKFIEADIAKEKIDELLLVKRLKLVSHATNNQTEEKKDLERKQLHELEMYNTKMDEEFTQMGEGFTTRQNHWIDKHNMEIINFTNKFKEETKRTTPKPSSNLIALNKQMEVAAKKREYKIAHDMQVKIKEMSKMEHEGFLKARETKYMKEIKNIQIRHNKENQALVLNMRKEYEELKKRRADCLNVILLKDGNERRSLEERHKTEQNVFGALLKGKIRNYPNPKSSIKNISNPPSVYSE